MLIDGYEVEQITPNKFKIKTPEAKEYDITKTPAGQYRCNCQGFIYRGNCKHTNEIMPKFDGDKAVKRHPRADIESVIQEVLPLIKPCFSKYEITGSYRRGLPTLKDIDIIALGDSACVKKAFDAANMQPIMSGSSIIRVRHGEIQLDVRFVSDPTEWGATLLFYTGSAQFNIGMRAHCKRHGLHLNEHGLYDITNNRLAGETEESIFEALNWPFIEPSKRDQVPANLLNIAPKLASNKLFDLRIL